MLGLLLHILSREPYTGPEVFRIADGLTGRKIGSGRYEQELSQLRELGFVDCSQGRWQATVSGLAFVYEHARAAPHLRAAVEALDTAIAHARGL